MPGKVVEACFCPPGAPDGLGNGALTGIRAQGMLKIRRVMRRRTEQKRKKAGRARAPAAKEYSMTDYSAMEARAARLLERWAAATGEYWQQQDN